MVSEMNINFTHKAKKIGRRKLFHFAFWCLFCEKVALRTCIHCWKMFMNEAWGRRGNIFLLVPQNVFLLIEFHLHLLIPSNKKMFFPSLPESITSFFMQVFNSFLHFFQFYLRIFTVYVCRTREFCNLINYDDFIH